MKELAKKRYDELTDVLNYSLERNRSKFTIGERICIHQERSHWLSTMGEFSTDNISEPKNKVSDKIEGKIQEVLSWIEIKNQNKEND